jgi:hypothetical protein
MASRRTPDPKPPSKPATDVPPPKAASVKSTAAPGKTAAPPKAKSAKTVAKPAPVTVPPAAATDVAAVPSKDPLPPMEPPAAGKAPPVKRSATLKPPKVRTAPAARPVVTPDVRRGMIAEAAYLRSEKRGFAPGHEDADWLAAEIEVDGLLGADSGAPQ